MPSSALRNAERNEYSADGSLPSICRYLYCASAACRFGDRFQTCRCPLLLSLNHEGYDCFKLFTVYLSGTYLPSFTRLRKEEGTFRCCAPNLIILEYIWRPPFHAHCTKIYPGPILHTLEQSRSKQQVQRLGRHITIWSTRLSLEAVE